MNWLKTITCAAVIASSSMGISAADMASNTSTQQADVPRHGQEMETVKNQFGQPRQELPAVGEPPITRWVYNGFTVYFEYDKVIHAVIHRQS